MLRWCYSANSIIRMVLYIWIVYSAFIFVFSRSMIGIIMGGVGIIASVEALRSVTSVRAMQLYIAYCFTNAIVSLAIGLAIVAGFKYNCYLAENQAACSTTSEQYAILMFVVGVCGGAFSAVVLFVIVNQTKCIQNCMSALSDRSV